MMEDVHLLKDFLLNHLWFPNSVGSKHEFPYHNTTLPQDIAKMVTEWGIFQGQI